MASILAAAFIVLAIVGWAIIRSRRDMEAEREQVRNWDELAQSLGEASAAAEVSTALGAALVSAFPQARVIVAVEDDDGALRTWTFGLGARRLRSIGGSPRDGAGSPRNRCERPGASSGRRADACVAGGSDVEASDSTDTGTQSGSLFALPLLTDSGRAIGSATLLFPAGPAARRCGRGARGRACRPRCQSPYAGPSPRARARRRRHTPAEPASRRSTDRRRPRALRAVQRRAAWGSRSAGTGMTRSAGRTASSTSPSGTSQDAESRQLS